MKRPVRTTQLAALDVLTLDTETTGLDAAAACVVQIAALPGVGAAVRDDAAYETLVNPGAPIPERSTAIHGIDDAAVRDAPDAATMLSQITPLIDGRVVVGHTISYDLAILERAAAKAGVPWTRPSALDVRLLARIAAPTLADYSLDSLCEWLGIGNTRRHSAMADARATQAVFAALLPRMREKGVRTLAQAEALSMRIAERAGVGDFIEIAATPFETPAALGRRGAAAAYTTRVRDVMSSPPLRLPGDTPLRAAVAKLIETRASSIFTDGADGSVGILTERDILRAVAADDAAALDAPVARYRQAPLLTILDDAFAYRAIGRMSRLNLRHLGVRDAHARVVGAVSARDLLRDQADGALLLGDETDAAEDAAALGRAWSKTPVMAQRLAADGVDGREIAEVISAEIRMLTRRATELAEAEMRADPAWGPPPKPYTVFVLGSAGRGESLLAADQDNAIVYAGDADDDLADRWCAELGARFADTLDMAGVPLCEGGVMGRTPEWRKSAGGWRATVDEWLKRRRPQDLLNVDIFFDSAAVQGDGALIDSLWRDAYARGAKTPAFTRALSETLAGWRAPVGSFGGFRLGADDRVDCKKGGLMPIFTAARILAIKHNLPARSTPARLDALVAADVISALQRDRIVEAHRVILRMMLKQQIADAAAGVRLTPRVAPATTLTKPDRKALRAAMETAGDAVDLAREGAL